MVFSFNSASVGGSIDIWDKPRPLRHIELKTARRKLEYPFSIPNWNGQMISFFEDNYRQIKPKMPYKSETCPKCIPLGTWDSQSNFKESFFRNRSHCIMIPERKQGEHFEVFADNRSCNFQWETLIINMEFAMSCCWPHVCLSLS